MSNPTMQELQARLRANRNKAAAFSEKNTKRNLAGQVGIGADDEWRDSNEWNDDCDKSDWESITDIFQNAIKRKGFSDDEVCNISDKMIKEVRNK